MGSRCPRRFSLTAKSKSTRSKRAGQADIYAGARAQLAALGADHVGFGAKRFVAASGTPFSIAGARPFSKACP
jgi:hypothetical protein